MAVAVLVVACTDNADESERRRGLPEDPVPGGRAVIGVFGEPPTLDPYAPEATDLTRSLVRPVYPSLYRITPTGGIAPDLAGRSVAIDGGVRVRLNKARWSNGRAITARDVVASILRAVPPSGFARVQSARATSRRTVELRGGVHTWKATLARGAFVLPGGSSSPPGGVFGGPYMIAKAVPGLEVVYRRNPEWTGPKPFLKRVSVTYVTGLLMMVRLLEDGRLDAAELPSSVNLDERLEEIGLQSDAALGYESVVLDFSSSDLTRAERLGVIRRLPISLIEEGLVRDDGRITRSLNPTPQSAAGPFGRTLGPGARPDSTVLLLAPAGDELLQLIQRVIDARLDDDGIDLDLVRLVPSELYGGRAPVGGIQIRRAMGAPGVEDPRRARRTLDRYPLFQVESVMAWRSGLHGIEVNPTLEGFLHNVQAWWWTTGARPAPGL